MHPSLSRRTPSAIKARVIIALFVAFGRTAAAASTPDFGPNVLIFDPAMTTIQARVDAVFAQQEKNQFGPERVAFLFKPGTYPLNVPLGFYTQALGLGREPDDVSIDGSIQSTARWMRNNNATCNFWRAAENLSFTPPAGQPAIWAVSQGTALRRVHVRGSLNLWDGGWASGGFLADCQVDGRINSGTQQQWLSRNADWGSWTGSSWNMVFVGVRTPPAGRWPKPAYTVVPLTPVIAEKPFLFIDEHGDYFVRVPSLSIAPTQGKSWPADRRGGRTLPIDRFYLAHADRDTADSINAALRAGKGLILTPGIYHLASALVVDQPETVVLGLGFPTLVADAGQPVLRLADVDGLRVGGVILDAGPLASPTLLEAGPAGSSASHARAPSVLSDIFCRAGGATAGSTDAFVTLNSRHVIGDNFWLWRADHGKGAGWSSSRNANGLIVNGDDVTLYGLFVEHTQGYQTEWNGNGGRVFFYQSEMPYDPPSQADWAHDGRSGYASYRVAPAVTTHEAWGLGVYCVFYKAPVVADSAIEAPVAPGIRFHHMVTLWLNGRPGSGIRHIINDRGDPVVGKSTARLAEGP